MTPPNPMNNDQYVPRAERGGRFRRTCPLCGKHFRTNNPRVVYDSLKCRTTMRNRRYYAAHREEKIARYVAARRERLKARTRPSPASVAGVEMKQDK